MRARELGSICKDAGNCDSEVKIGHDVRSDVSHEASMNSDDWQNVDYTEPISTKGACASKNCTQLATPMSDRDFIFWIHVWESNTDVHVCFFLPNKSNSCHLGAKCWVSHPSRLYSSRRRISPTRVLTAAAKLNQFSTIPRKA